MRSGQVLGQGISPYGYDYVSRTSTSQAALIINEQEAAVIRQIFEAFAKGTAICSIARSLEAQGVTTRLGRTLWDGTHLKTILQRLTYTGTRYYNTVTTVTLSSGSSSKKKRSTYIPKDRSEWIGVKVPAIVSQELFDTVQERLQQNKQRYLRPAIQHLLGGMLRCGECGSAMYSYDRYYTKMTKEPKLGVYHKAAYNCIWRARAHAHCDEVIERCHNSEIRTHILENRVLQLIRDVLCDPDKLRHCIEGPTESDSMERKKFRRRLTDIDKRVKAADAERRRIINLYATDELSKDAYVNASTAIDRELEVLKRARADVAASQRLSKRTELDVRVRQFCERARARFERCGDFDTRRQFLLDHIERVVYHPRSVELVGSIPGDPTGSDGTAGAVPFRIEGKIRRIKTILGPRPQNQEAKASGHLAAVSHA